jgi:ABC-type Fe3+/spermidine/putrescine transport system ATPase subunit
MGEITPYIEVRNLTVAYGDKVVVHGISFSVAPGEHLSLLGPSGCGKSTTLRCIAGLETPTEGEIVIDSRVVFSSERGINIPTEKRNLSMVFQSYAIWPHMTVFDNVAYGLRTRKQRDVDIDAQVMSALEMVGMKDLASRPATDLSGGQQQRVALARSYACRPKVILLDEPLSNLDARLRTRMREEMKELQQQFAASTLYVTHDQEEAMAMSNRVIVMREGHIEQEGPPLEIYNQPRSRFVADFIGAANIITGKLADSSSARPVLDVGGGILLSCAPRDSMPEPGPDGKHTVAVRSVYAELSTQPTPAAQNQWPATIEQRILLGDIVTYFIRWPGGLIRVHGFPGALLEEKASVFLTIPPERAILVDGNV